MDDIELIEGLKTKNNSAFAELVGSFQSKVYNTCFGFLQNQEDARDVAQEVFIEVYCSINNFKSNSKLSTWIYRIAVNKSLDHIAMKKRKKRFSQAMVILGLAESRNEENKITDFSNPHADLEKQERMMVLSKAIDQLPENQKTALTLNKYESMSYEEIAEVMGISFSAVQSLIHRSKKNLQKILSNYFAEKE